MGNCLVLCGHNRVSCFAAVETSKNRNIVQLLKSDGEIFEFSTPVLVKDVLRKFSGFDVALAKKTPLHLPPNFWLKLGNRYHLIPRLETVKESRMVENEDSSGVKRIKVVITKKQLQDLLSKEVLAVDIISVLRSKTGDSDGDEEEEEEDDMTIWKPKLESIPEEHETSSVF